MHYFAFAAVQTHRPFVTPIFAWSDIQRQKGSFLLFDKEAKTAK